MGGNYKFVKAPKDYPGKTYAWKKLQRVLEHHLVWWENTGHAVNPEEVIHHKNKDTKDNRFENLEMMKRGEHTKLHHPSSKILLKCAHCGVEFERSKKATEWKQARGAKRSFCCRKHAGLFSGPINSKNRAGGRKGRR